MLDTPCMEIDQHKPNKVCFSPFKIYYCESCLGMIMEQPMNIIQCKSLSFYHSSNFWLFMQVTSKMHWHYNSGKIPTCHMYVGLLVNVVVVLTSMKIESHELVLPMFIHVLYHALAPNSKQSAPSF